MMEENRMKMWGWLLSVCFLMVGPGTLVGTVGAFEMEGPCDDLPPLCVLPWGCSGVSIPILTSDWVSNPSADIGRRNIGIFAYMGDVGSLHRYSLTGIAGGANTECDGGNLDSDAMNAFLNTITSGGACPPDDFAAVASARLPSLMQELDAVLAGTAAAENFPTTVINTMTAGC